MPRSGRLRNFIREYKESDRFEKLSFIPPFLILVVECILLTHELSTEQPDIMVIELTTILLLISIVEILFVGQEIHDHYSRTNFDRLLTIRLDDFITKNKNENVQQIVSDFTNNYPLYSNKRNEIYHIACQIMQTHKEEKYEEKLQELLKIFCDKNNKDTVDELLKNFIKKYPKYKKSRIEIYEKICELKKE